MMDLSAWLDQIQTLHPQTIELGLERISTVAKKLAIKKFTCPVITVGGTNGKGSCVRFLESILIASGYNVASYTSPHLLAFNERIRINLLDVDDHTLCNAFAVIEKARGDIRLTFFEFTTLAALWIFQRSKLDVVILEVGLGGRLDAVNIVDADIAVLASVDVDHIEWLGDTREIIGLEKAGIFRGDQSAVCGDTDPPTSVIDYAKKIGTSLYKVNEHYTYKVFEDEWEWSTGELTLKHLPLPNLPVQNCATVLMVITLLQKQLAIDESAIYEGIKHARLSGRFQIIDNPPCILDVAHNPASARLLAANVGKMPVTGNIYAVVGMLNDKDVSNTFAPMAPFISKWFCGTLNTARGAKASTLQQVLAKLQVQDSSIYDSVKLAFMAAVNRLQQNERIIVFGSFYTVAEIVNLLHNSQNNKEQLKNEERVWLYN